MKTIIKRVGKSRYSRFSAMIILVCGISGGAISQDAKKAVNSTNSQEVSAADQTPSPTPSSTPISLSDVVSEAESTRNKLESIRKGVADIQGEAVIETGLSELQKQALARKPETAKVLSGSPSLEALRIIEQDWQALTKEIPAWDSALKIQITQIDLYLAEIKRQEEVWSKTLQAINKPAKESENQQDVPLPESETASANGIPAELLESINSTIAAIEETEKDVNKRKADVLKLQTRISKQEVDVKGTLDSISSLREKALSNLLVKDSQPIWNAGIRKDSLATVVAEAGDSYRTQISAIREYVSQKRIGFVMHGLVFVLFACVLYWARRRLRVFVEKEPELKPAYSAFEFPIVVAIILSIMLSSWFYPQAPRLLSAMLGAAALLPGVLYLRKILDPQLYPILNALVIFYLADLIRFVTSTLPLLSRVLFLVEMVAVMVFLIWFLRKKDESGDAEHQRIYVVVKRIIPVLLVLFGIAIVANIPGYVSLSFIIGNGVMGSAYTALILYAAIQIIKSLVVFGFRVRPFSGLGMVRTHRDLIKDRIFQILKWSAVVAWVLLTLNIFSVRASVVGFIREKLAAELVLGSLSISLGDVLLFGFTVWFAFALSRIVRFVLAEDIYPRINLAGGVPYAISTMLHYTLLVVGVLLAIAALGIDLTKFTILAGAFGVGLGFGMQAIVNNFVSGLILLFERPVKVDDFVQVGTHQGELKRIGLRASVLRTLDGSEVIVPNGQLISEEVTNWTFSDQERRLEVNVGVAYGSDPRVVMEILDKIGAENGDILQTPAPRSIFVAFGESSLDFQLRAWTDKADQWVVVRSDLTLAVHDALEEADIEIPFPQRDLYLRGVDESALKALTISPGN